MAKRKRYAALDFRPSFDIWENQERAMWEVLKPRLHNVMDKLSLPDLMLGCYLAGLNHMHEALQKSGELK